MDLQAEAARVLDEAEAMLPDDIQNSPTAMDSDAASILDDATAAVARGEEPAQVRLSYPNALLDNSNSSSVNGADEKAMSPGAVMRQAEMSALKSAEQSLAQVVGKATSAGSPGASAGNSRSPPDHSPSPRMPGHLAAASQALLRPQGMPVNPAPNLTGKARPLSEKQSVPSTRLATS